MSEPNDRDRGLYEKFRDIDRTDGRSLRGEKHHGCEYFVLDLDHDPHAVAALKAYSLSCRRSHPKLAADLAQKVDQMVLGFSGSDDRYRIQVEVDVSTHYETIDLLCEVVGRLLMDVGQHINPQIVSDLDLREIQRRAECHVARMLKVPK